MKTVDMAKENNFVLREAAKSAQMGYFDHLSAGGKRDPAEERWIEALTAGADAITQVAVLESRLAQVERERDALRDDLRHSFDPCTVCKKQDICEQYCPQNNYNCLDCKDKHRCICHNCTADNDLWEWRGVCEENTKDGADV